eukprot:TRINITY_DN56300_c0_g1_i1.p1 TRINITY_DN56300_c0_g1~~TRINITY_DN56300_c0_g1_i1.p1  ORF type:complete len:571 (-),score=72.87 TRINITY_DN56300_c0_g1_i1:80-1792(-)
MSAASRSAPAMGHQQDHALRTLRRAVQLHSARRAEVAASTAPCVHTSVVGTAVAGGAGVGDGAGCGWRQAPPWDGFSQTDKPPKQPPLASQCQLSVSQSFRDVSQMAQEFSNASREKQMVGGRARGFADLWPPGNVSTQISSDMGIRGNLEQSRPASQHGACGYSQGPPLAWITAPSALHEGDGCGYPSMTHPPLAIGGPVLPAPESQVHATCQRTPLAPPPVEAYHGSAALSSDVTAAAAALAVALGVNRGVSIGGYCDVGGEAVVGAMIEVARGGKPSGADVVCEGGDCAGHGTVRRRAMAKKSRSKSPNHHRRQSRASPSPKRRSSHCGGGERRKVKVSPPKRRRMRYKAPPPPSPSPSTSNCGSLSERHCCGGAHSEERADVATTPSHNHEASETQHGADASPSPKSANNQRHSSTAIAATRGEFLTFARIATAASADALSRLGPDFCFVGQEYAAQCGDSFSDHEDETRKALALLEEYQRVSAASDSALEDVATAVEAALAAASSALLVRSSPWTTAAMSVSAPRLRIAAEQAAFPLEGPSIGLGCLHVPRRRRAIDGIIAPTRP